MKKRRGRKIQGKTLFSKLILEKGITLKKFAEMTGIHYVTARRWSAGLGTPPKIYIDYLKNL